MKLYYVSHFRFPSERTASSVIVRTCEEFAKQGVDTTLVIPKRRKDKEDDNNLYSYYGVDSNFSIDKTWFIDLFEKIGGKVSFVLELIFFNFSLFFYALKHKDGIFYVRSIRDVYLLSFLNRKYVLEIHDFYESSLSFLNKRVFKKAYKFVVTNQYKIDAISKKYDLPKEIFLHKPSAVNIEMFDIDISKEDARKKVDLPINEKIVLYAGHLFDWKGVDTLLEAHKFLPDYKIYFIGGTDGDLKVMKDKAEEMNTKNVKFLGMKPHEDIPFYYKSADVLVLPNTAKMDVSKYETSPVKLFEYMASKTPIVASDIPSVRNIANDKMVWFFEADNAENLSKVIESINNTGDSILKKTDLCFKEVGQYRWSNRIRDIINFLK